MKIRFVFLVVFFFFGFQGETFAKSWQCPGNEPSAELKKIDHLEYLKIDRYRGYKPAWMAMDRVYRSAIYDWETAASRNSYLADRNSYLDAYMYQERLRQLQEKYPEDIEIWEIAKTHFGFPVYAVLIGDSEKTTKADVLHVAGLHGNEMITLNYALDAIDTLLENDTEVISQLKERFNLWFVPMANPDGNWLSMRRAHADSYGKKNGKNTDGTCECYAYEGVDLSDNFPRRNSEEPIEAEVQGLVNLVNSRHFVLGLSLHTGGSGFYSPPLLIGQLEKERTLVYQFSADIAEKFPDLNSKPLVSNTDLREVVWLHQDKGIPAFVFDYPANIAPMEPLHREAARAVGKSFIQEFWLALEKKAFLDGLVVDVDGRPIQAKLHQQQSLRKEQVWEVMETGEFSLIFPNKEIIRLQVTAPGYTSAEKRIDLREGQKKITIVLRRQE